MQRGTILALDVASKTGVAFGRPGEVPRLQTIDFRGKDELPDVYGRAIEWMATRLRDVPPDMVVIERTVPPSGAFGATNHATTMLTIGLFGIFAGIVRCKGIRLELASINTWKKHFLGTAKLKRTEAKKAAIDRCHLLGWSVDDDNQADAAGIWDWAGQTFMGKTPEALHLFGEKKTCVT